MRAPTGNSKCEAAVLGPGPTAQEKIGAAEAVCQSRIQPPDVRNRGTCLVADGEPQDLRRALGCAASYTLARC